MSDQQIIVRTSKGLVEGLFDAIDNLNQRKIDPEHARAIAHTARTIVRVAEVELDFMRFSREGQADPDLKSLKITDASAA